MMTIQIAPANEDTFSDTTGADVEASCARFDELAESAIRTAYPDANVEWDSLNGIDTVRVICDADDETCERQRHDITLDVGDILNRVHNGQYGEWIVEADA